MHGMEKKEERERQLCVCACVCVLEREKERERENEDIKSPHQSQMSMSEMTSANFGNRSAQFIGGSFYRPQSKETFEVFYTVY